MNPTYDFSGQVALVTGAGMGVDTSRAFTADAHMLHHELRDRGIHVGHTAIGGTIAPGGDHEPDDVAETLWRHHTQRTTSRSGSALTRPSLTIQRLAAVAVIVVGAALFASALRGITQTNTRLAATPAHTTSDRALVGPTSFDCPRHGANDEV